MASLTPTSYYDYDSTPYMQGLKSDPLSFNSSNNNSGYGFTRSKYDTFLPRSPSMDYKPDASLRDDYKRGAMDYAPTQSPVLAPSFNAQDGYQAIQGIAQSTAPGDGGVRDATHAQLAQQATSDLSTIASAKDPDAVAKAILSQPQYGAGSLGGMMIGVGLAAMSGRKPDEMFQAGLNSQAYFEGEDRKAQTSDYLRNNVKALLDQGYSPNSISAAISNGDNSLLQMKQLSPEEKRAQALEDEQRGNKEWDRRTAIGQQNAIELKNTESADAQARLDSQEAKQAQAEKQKQTQLNSKYWIDKETNEPLILNSEYKGYQSSFQRVHNTIGVKTSAFDQANSNLDDARTFKTSGDDTASRASYMQALEQYVKGVMGSGNRSLDDHQLEALGVDPSWIANKTGKFALAAGFSPSDNNIKYIQSAIDTDSKASTKEANNLVKGEIDRLVKTRGLSIPQATRLANSYTSTTLGSRTYDPYGVFGEPTGVDVNNGVLKQNESSSSKTPKEKSGSSLLDQAMDE